MKLVKSAELASNAAMFATRSLRTFLPLFLTGISAIACVPPAEPEAPVEEPVPVDENGIPWAPGEAPTDRAATTREVTPEPTREERPAEYYKDDGIQQSSAGPVCSGKATPALRADIDVRAKQTRVCYDRVPAERAGAKGDIKVSVRVNRSGEVASAEVLSDTLGVPAVTSCVLESLKKPFSETPPRGGCAMFVIPLHLESEAVQSDAPAESSE